VEGYCPRQRNESGLIPNPPAAIDSPYDSDHADAVLNRRRANENGCIFNSFFNPERRHRFSDGLPHHPQKSRD
jgi:hypothetical protein